MPEEPVDPVATEPVAQEPAKEEPAPPVTARKSNGDAKPGPGAAGNGEGEAVQEDITALRSKSEEVAAALAAREKELMDRLARLQADFENFRRRSREDAANAQNRGKESFLKAFLPVLDNLDRAILHSEDAGVKLLGKQVAETLTTQGIEALVPEGEPFDATRHEAIAQEPREGTAAGTVLTVVEKGYALEGRVVRPARVIVAA